MHSGVEDASTYYGDEGVALQQEFFDHFLKGAKNGWEKTSPVTLVVRDPGRESGEKRAEKEWPLSRTKWLSYHLDASNGALVGEAPSAPAQSTFEATKSASLFDVTFDKDFEFTGPLAAHLWVASSTTDADLFLTLQLFDRDGKEVTFLGQEDPAAPVTQGWLRASQRKLDLRRSKPYRPWHTHDEVQKLTPGEFYPVDVEIWPTSIVVHPGYKLVLRIEGSDFQREPAKEGPSKTLRGSGIFLHNDSVDRPVPEFAGATTVATGPSRDSFLLLPVIPSR